MICFNHVMIVQTSVIQTNDFMTSLLVFHTSDYFKYICHIIINNNDNLIFIRSHLADQVKHTDTNYI